MGLADRPAEDMLPFGSAEEPRVCRSLKMHRFPKASNASHAYQRNERRSHSSSRKSLLFPFRKTHVLSVPPIKL